MLSRSRLRGTGLAALLALATALTGCSLIEPPPPDNVVNSVNRAVDAIRATDGVDEVSATISRREHVAVPLNELWTASIEVRAEADVAGFGPLAEAVERHVESARDIVLATATVRLPADDAGAEVALDVPSGAAGDIADATVSLRQIEHATTVHVESHQSLATVTVNSPEALIQAIADLRALPSFGQGALTAVTVEATAPSGGTRRLTTSALSPSADLLPFLGELAPRADIGAFFYNGQRADEPIGEASVWRPSLRVEATSPRSARTITGLLTGLEPAVASESGVPRASFSVYTPADGSAFERSGFLGLALDSPAPDDYVDAPRADATDADLYGGLPETTDADRGESPDAMSLDPAAAALQLGSDLRRVTALLEEAGDTAGIRGPATVEVSACDSGVGQHVRGYVILPIFEIVDSPMAPFDAVRRSWNRQGFITTDRAMGTDLYTQQDPSDSLRDLTIRGTSAGLSLSATSTCVVSG
ncbi:hypothetical protein GY21_12185 [Cryobacterium roopkundense]|uniref:Uncharacterized protein n=1 Tax=Cryobacterium roopkundense TaxID=1001240 RepID=A0A099J3J4_9MICO|nr:hypothetical protein [Cryobacterium roopkundense]KGJ72916.1 hypothetical protein GY21_12185 [Cryobacterium roopkundense]MBB5642074.1 hypothetical protein [Cryobacterium roopkundense]